MTDSIQRLMTLDGSIRAVTIDARQTLQHVLDVQQPGALAESLGELIMGAVLVREAMSPDHRLQMTMRHPAYSVYADSLTSTAARGWVAVRENAVATPQLHVARVLEDGQLHEGAVEAHERVSDTLTHYMLTSEQIMSTVGVSCIVEDGKVKIARGFLVQLMPQPHVDALEAATQALENLHPEWNTFDDDELAHAILGQPARILSEHGIGFGCTCSAESVVNALVAAGYDEIQAMIQDGHPVEVVCEYCRTAYNVPVARLKSLIA